uniref:ZU5 domain-containing protein n=1 Tax=Strigamia maritima TaxID=126957 RepID=T1J864_STRMM
MKDVTREEAVLYLLNLQDRIDLIVQYRREEYDSIVASQAGDSFYVRTHFNYDNVNKSELSFRIGDVFHVVDTLYNGVVGSWQVYRIGRNNQQTQKGIIPNKNRAEELAVERANSAKKESFSESRGSFFKRRSARRTKILMDSASKFPSYERITLRHPGFTRPVILLGPLSDAARDKLLKDSPAKYVSPQLDNHLDDSPKSKSAVIVRLSAIKEISERGKHAVVDITPNAVDRLNYAQFYPIVIFMRADNKHVIKDLRSRLSKSGKSSKKLFDHMVKLEKTWSHIFTATVTLTSADTWYKKIKEVIEMQQQQPIWISETKPEEPITDDFLFPMTSRLSYASSPESDLDLATDINHRTTNELTTPSYGDRRLVKASSDPSIATQEDIGLPSYHGPPPYNATGTEEQFYSKYYSSNENRNSISQHAAEPRHKFNAYNSRPVSDTYSERTNGDPMDPYSTKSRSPPKVPPKIDRGSKPFHLRSAHERLFGLNDNVEPNVGAGNYINATQKSPEKPYSYQNSCETLSYGSDSYGKLPVGLPDDAKARELQLRMLHDPYRYTRSTSQPIRNKMLELNAQPKYSRNDYKPVPPPKPKNYRSPNSGLPAENYWNREDEMARNKLMYDIAKPDGGRSNNYNENDYAMRPATNYYAGKSYGLNDHNTISERLVNGGMKTRCDSDSAGFDSGQGSSLDRNYDTTHKTASPSRRGGGGGYYYNVPPPREVAHHHRDASGLDLSNRENRGSAFELYKKPNSLHGFSPLTVNVDTLKSVGIVDVDVDVESTSGSSSSSTSTSEDSQDGNANVREDKHVILGSSRGKFGIEGGKIECSKTGVCLVIPQGALTNTDQEIFFKVCRDNSILLPVDKDKDEKLLSPFVICGPQGLTFSKPVELRIPYSTENQNWKIASETPTGGSSKWQNLSPNKESKDGDYWVLKIYNYLNVPMKILANVNTVEVIYYIYSIPRICFNPRSTEKAVESSSSCSSSSTSTSEDSQDGNVQEDNVILGSGRGKFGIEGGKIVCSKTGVCLVIPPGALPPNSEQEIFLKVCQDNKLLPPLDKDKGDSNFNREKLLSPLVMCGPHGVNFSKPVELRLPHCATKNQEDWSFALKISETPTGNQSKWQNLSLDKESQQWRVDGDYVILLVDHF